MEETAVLTYCLQGGGEGVEMEMGYPTPEKAWRPPTNLHPGQHFCMKWSGYTRGVATAKTLGVPCVVMMTS